jgi:hypothetical protein
MCALYAVSSEDAQLVVTTVVGRVIGNSPLRNNTLVTAPPSHRFVLFHIGNKDIVSENRIFCSVAYLI